MKRIVIRVDDDADGAWRVSVRPTAGPDLVEPYTMAATVLVRPEHPSRRLPATPPDRMPPAGEPVAALCAGDVELLTALLQRIRRSRPRPGDVSTYGRWLFECLLAPAWGAIQGHPDVVRDQAVELALRWSSMAGDLHRLVWEAMRDAVAPLAGHPAGVVAITRLVPAARREVTPVSGLPSVLFATSVALTDPTIRPGAMYMGLLRHLDLAGRSRSRAIAGASGDDLHDACLRWAPDVVHLVAHGTLLDDGRGALMLRGDGGTERETDAAGLLAALTAGGRSPLAVMLSACNSGSGGEHGEDPTDTAPLAAQLVAGGIPVVSAMAGEVRETACRLYTRKLAAAVHEGQPVVTASAHGRRAALIGSESPGDDIDWALPALYLAEYVDPAQRLVDGAGAVALTRLVDSLGLRHEPVFIGRQDILGAADEAVETDAVGVIAVLAEGPTSGMGGTRLLREIGCRLLRDGHLPLLLGPYQEARSTPTTSRGLVHAILWQLIRVAEAMDLRPFVPVTLLDEMSPADGQALRATVDHDVPALARSAVRRRLRDLLDRPGDLDPATARDLLSHDFTQLTTRAAEERGEPFGERSRTVLLCDDVHAWAEPPADAHRPPLTALDCLLAMLTSTGLSSASRPAPVVLTASTTQGAGKTVGIWSADGRPGYRIFPMDDLTPEERVVGYQWVLLHPWTTRPEEEREMFGTVYTPRPGKSQPWEDTLRKVGGRPTSVRDRLYFAADLALLHESCRRDDDEQAWRRYVDGHPEYRL